jgi:hypothetical protein
MFARLWSAGKMPRNRPVRSRTTRLLVESLEDRRVLAFALDWVATAGSTGEDYAAAITLDGAGNSYVHGAFSGTVDFDPGPGTLNLTASPTAFNGRDMYVAKYDGNGALLWAQRMTGTGDEGNSVLPDGVAVDGAGNVFVAGMFQGAGDYGPFALTSLNGGADAFVAKLDANGNFQWARRMGGPSDRDGAADLALDAAGNVIVVGNVKNGTADFGSYSVTLNQWGNAFITKLDTSGNFLWTQIVQQTTSAGNNAGASARAVTVHSGGSIFVGGGFDGEVDFDPGAGSQILKSVKRAGGFYTLDGFMLKLSSTGAFQKVGALGGSLESEYVNDLVEDGAGNVVVTGQGEVRFTFAKNKNISGSTGAYVFKTDASMNVQWAKSFGGGERPSVDVDGANNIYTTGGFIGTVDFDPGSGSFPLTSEGGAARRDIFLSILTPAGSFLDAFRVGDGLDDGDFGHGDTAFGIDVDASGDIYLAGHFDGAPDFDPSAGTTIAASNGFADSFVARYSQTSSLATASGNSDADAALLLFLMDGDDEDDRRG